MQWFVFSLVIIGNSFGIWLLFSVPKMNKNIVKNRPNLSIIIPARNEALRILPLLTSLKEQIKTNDEVIVVDDHSTDQTASIAQSMNAIVVSAKALPKGWFGKPWACYQGAEAAKHNILIFLDADTVIRKGGLDALVDTFLKTKTPMSVQPYHRTKKLYEQFSVMFNIMVLMTTGQFTPLKEEIKTASFFGPCQLVTKEDYWAIGGHHIAKHAILEDIALGKAYTELTKQKTRTFVGKGLIDFRMYEEGFSKLIEGWSKNFATGAMLIPKWLLVTTSVWITGLFISFLSGVAPFMWVQNAYLIGYGLTGLTFYILARKAGNFSPIVMIFYPIYVLFFVIVFVRSIIKLKKNKQVTWKGRTLDV
jgi:4,4'-diaponeurosporenoate glycosyltransferase